MGSVNKVILIGNLGRDAELKYTVGGTAVATFSIATTETWTDKNQQRQERTEWHRAVLWGKQAESLQEYLVKGKQVFIEGKLQTREWLDKDGNKRFTTEIKAERVTLLGGGERSKESRRSTGDESPEYPEGDAGLTDYEARKEALRQEADARYDTVLPPSSPVTPLSDDDIPF